MTELSTANEFLFNVVIIFQGLDVVSTNLAIGVGAREGNSRVEKLMRFLGKGWHIPKVLLSVGGAYMAFWTEYEWLTTALLLLINAGLFWLVFLNNMRVYRKLKGNEK